MTTESSEEYLEALYRLKERGERSTTTKVARELGVAPSSATLMLKKLAKGGYLRHHPYRGVTLTRKGEEVGRGILRKHRVMERFLSSLGLSPSRAHQKACELEHHIPEEVEAAIHRRMEAQRLPRGVPTGSLPLTGLLEGQRGVVSFLSGGTSACRRLADMGLTPGTEVEVLKSALFRGPLMVRVRDTTLAVGRGLASRVFVKPLG
ncbi:MAG: metal-dependent transcriptional regulator [Candidatus Hadarchaeales archaeon]